MSGADAHDAEGPALPSRPGAPLQLFTVTVSGPGSTRWGVLVRTSDEETAAAMVRARGHTVVAVRRGQTRRPSRLPAPTECAVCGYSLAGLPAGEGRVVVCPECGSGNLPEPARSAVFRTVRKRSAAGCIVIIVAAATIALLLALIGLLR